MVYQLPNGKFRVQIRKVGFPRFDRVFETRADAEMAERQFLGKNCTPTLYTADTLLRQAAEGYFGSTLFLNKKDHTRRGELSKIKPVLAALGDYALKHLEDGQRIADYRDQRSRQISPKTQRIVSPETIRLELAALAAVFDWAIERRILIRKPTIGIQRPHGKPRQRRLLESEVLRLNLHLSSPGVHPFLKEAARFIALLRELGCRPGELAAIWVKDLNTTKKTACFRDTKNKETRLVPLQERACELVEEQIEFGKVSCPESPFLFTTLTRTGKPRAYEYKGGVSLLKNAGILDADFHAHAVRREFISNALEHGIAHNDIMKQVGQKSITALMMYDQGKANHPDVKERLAAEAEKRRDEEDSLLANALGTSVEDLRAFREGRYRITDSVNPRHPGKEQSHIRLVHSSRDKEEAG